MNLIKLHMDNAEELLARRIKHLNQPFITRTVLTGLDYRLLASLSALQPDPARSQEKLDTGNPFQLFLAVYQGLQHDLSATFKAIEEVAEGIGESVTPYLEQAFQLAPIDLEPEVPAPGSPLVRSLLLNHAASLPEPWLLSLLQQTSANMDDSQIAAALLQLSEQQNPEHRPLLQTYAASEMPRSRLAALLSLVRQGCPRAQQQLSEENADTLQLSFPAWHAACWLHPETFADVSPLALAFTGHPAVLTKLIEQMEHAPTMTDAYQAWLWITARQLPHYPAVQAADAPAQHVAPTSGTQPDTAAASHWASQQKWHPEQRYFLGQPLNQAGLKRLTQNFTGRCFSLLATHQHLLGQPANSRLTGFCLPSGKQTTSGTKEPSYE